MWVRIRTNLATEGAEAEGVEEGAGADLAYVRGGGGGGCAAAAPPAAARLRPLIKKQHPRAVDDVGLDAADVQYLLDLCDPYHVVVRRPPYLPAATEIKTSSSTPTLLKTKNKKEQKGEESNLWLRQGWGNAADLPE